MTDGKEALPSSADIMRQTQEFKKRMEAMIEMIGPQATMLRAAYEALVREGFTEKEALEIVKARGYLFS